MTNPTARVAVVVVNWQGWADTVACLESLLLLDTPETGIFVCDNASADASVVRLREWAVARLPALNSRRAALGLAAMRFRDLTGPGDPTEPSLHAVTLIETGANLGYAGGTNVGLRAALKEDYGFFWVLNNDTEVLPDSLDCLLARLQEEAGIGLCGSTLVYFDRPDLVQNLGGGGFDRLKGRGVPLGFRTPLSAPVDRDTVERRLAYVNGASVLVRRSFLERVGFMAEDYFLYWEEVDWAMRGRGQFRLGYAPRSIVRHKVGRSIGTNDFGDSSPLSQYYYTRNRLRICWRFAKMGLPFAFLDSGRDALRWLARGNRARATIVVRAMLGLPYRTPG